MVEFRPISIADKEEIVKRLRAENARSADYNFGNLFMWDSWYNKHVAFAGDRLIIEMRSSKCQIHECPYYLFPAGSGPLAHAIDCMKEYSVERGCDFVLRGITEEQRALLESEFPGRFAFSETRDSFDYIYLAEKISTFAGQKFHGKRNFCNRFQKNYNWDFVKLTPELIPGCMELFDKWTQNIGEAADGMSDEYKAITKGFENWDALDLEGGVLRVEGEIIGFAVGERASSDTFDVHFEKALNEYSGAYPMVCREFARQIMRDHPDVVYINREDDMGHENLRKAKMDCYPEYLLKKYKAREN